MSNNDVETKRVEVPERAADRQVDGDHYKYMKIQPAEYCEKNNLSGLESSIVKYISRHRSKNGIIDLDKAIHCIELLKEYTYK